MGRSTLTTLLCGLLLLPLLSPCAHAAQDRIVLTYAFPQPFIEAEGRYVSVTMGELPLRRKTGEPVLPYKPARVLLPRGRRLLGIEIETGEKVTLEGRYTVRPAQEPVPLSYNGEPVVTAPDQAIYGSPSPFPTELKSVISIQRKGPYTILLFSVNPVCYIPSQGELSYYKSLTVTVNLAPGAEKVSRPLRRRPKAGDGRFIRQGVENLEALSTYRDAEADGGRGGMTPETGGPLGDYPHVIITSQALENATGSYRFQDLRDQRIARGIGSTIVTTEYIYANFDGTRPAGGTDNQTRIRNFIRWARDNWGTEYVLLGGYSGIIPVRYLNADGTNIPADMYYGNLDGTFDHDADGTYGEPGDGEGGGEVDLYAEIFIGRACVENDTDVSHFVRKTLAYETSSSESLHQVCMVGEHLGFGGDSEYAKPSMEEIRLGSSAHGYTTKGFAEDEFFQASTLYDADGTWAKSQLISIINTGVHILNHLGHANYTYDMKLYTSDLPSLTNTDYFFAYSQGCMPGGFDTTNCFGEVVTTMEWGAFAVVLNARYGWGAYNTTAGPSQYYDREFWDALFGEGISELGQMNADSKEDNDFRISGSRMRWCFYELNLFGDPATQIQNISSEGTVAFSADAYPLPGTASVTVMDLDLDTDPDTPDTVSVEVRSDTETTPESVLLTETGQSTKTFYGSLPLAAGTPSAGDGTLQVADGDVLTVVYHDADDGTGNPADVQDTATADGSGPSITNIQCVPSVTSCTISWETNEPADSLVKYGETTPPSGESADAALTTSHSLRIMGLDPLTMYSFEVASSDSVGNTTTDDNAGSYYQFTTLERGAILFVDDDEGDAHESYFTDALDDNLYGYDLRDVAVEGSPAFGDMDDYLIVIWNCGFEYSASGSGLTTTEESALSEYMDSGGNVFLCGQDILYNGVSSGFRTDYLHLADYGSDDQTTEAVGIAGDRISDGMNLSLSYPFTNWSDSLSPDALSCGAFLTDGSTTYPYCATRYPHDEEEGPFRIVFFAFPFESISTTAADPHNAATVMDRVLRFLSPIEIVEPLPPYGLNDRPTDISICGADFRDGLSASIGGAELAVGSVTATHIAATVPGGLATGLHDLTVENPDSLRAYLPDAYTALDPAEDSDQDGLTNLAEVVTHGTNPLRADTDGDLLSDYDEIGFGANPLLPDTDGDGLTDYEEVNHDGNPGYNPYDPDTNPSGTDTDLNNPDSDGDGFSDLLEHANGSNPLDALSTPSAICVNFQAAHSQNPQGYAPDCGRDYANRGFGWRP